MFLSGIFSDNQLDTAPTLTNTVKNMVGKCAWCGEDINEGDSFKTNEQTEEKVHEGCFGEYCNSRGLGCQE